MSQLQDLTEGRSVPPTPTGWTLLRCGWPALLLAFLIGGGLALASSLPGDQNPYALSLAALAEGRWWTPATHIFVVEGMGAMALAAIAFVTGLFAVGAGNPDWMGGWRTPAVFLACGLMAGAVYLLSGGEGVLAGGWPAGLGLGAYWLAAGRWPRRPDEVSNPETAVRHGLNLALRWLFLFMIFGSQISTGNLTLPFAVGPWPFLAALGGGAAILFALGAWGGRRGDQLAGALVLIAWAAAAALWLESLIGNEPLLLGLAPALFAGVALGGVFGLAERGLAAIRAG